MDYVASFGKENTALPPTSFSTSTVKEEINMGNERDLDNNIINDDNNNKKNLILNGNGNDNINEDIDIIEQIEVIK